jgi:hypothetical protein
VYAIHRPSGDGNGLLFLVPLIALARAGDRPHAQLVERQVENLVSPVDRRRNEQVLTVGAQAHDGREGRLHARVELHGKTQRPGGRWRARSPPEAGPDEREQQDG